MEGLGYVLISKYKIAFFISYQLIPSHVALSCLLSTNAVFIQLIKSQSLLNPLSASRGEYFLTGNANREYKSLVPEMSDLR